MTLKYTKKQTNHIVTFNYNDNIISYQEYIKMIKILKKWYQKQIKLVEANYINILNSQKFQSVNKIANYHQKILIELIEKIITYYPVVKTIKFGIFISNSFARGTNLIDSDFDLNFVYESKDNEIGLQIEEQISYALSKIVSKYRDFVHDSITHRMHLLPNNIIYNENDTVIFIAKWDKHKIKYPITKGNEKLMLNYCYGKRDINSYIKYINYFVQENEINEWLYYQKIIYGKKYISTIFKEIIKKENEIVSLTNFSKTYNSLIDTLIKDFKKEKETFGNIDFSNMQNFKKYFKNLTYNKFFTVIALNKKKDLFNKKKFAFNNIYANIFDKNYFHVLKIYIGNIMCFNYICDIYGIEFRTRFYNEIRKEFKSFYNNKLNDEEDVIHKFLRLANEIYDYSILILKEMKIPEKESKIIFNPYNEYINIENYSPFSYINEVSKEYQKKSFMLPFVKINDEIIPIHPDTFDDLKIKRNKIIYKKLVYPTSSYRTVYEPKENLCYKLPLLRKITRSIRNLPNKELERSMVAMELLEKYSFANFNFLKEECYFNKDENYNYIKREMPPIKTYPWFYIIASQNFDKFFQIKCIKNIIASWMFFASKGIYFESPHTQNYLFDEEANIYYRDLSDIRSLDYEVMMPSFYKNLNNKNEMLSVFFDRAICNQNLEHLFKYCKTMTENDFEDVHNFIKDEINKYNLDFPDYSMDYSKTKGGHIPEKVIKTRWR